MIIKATLSKENATGVATIALKYSLHLTDAPITESVVEIANVRLTGS